MTMTQHTPGPWGVGFSADNNIHCVDARDSEGLFFEVCEVWGVKSDKIEEPESHANARLIAAAPELLEALQALLAPLGPSGYVLPAGAGATAMARRAIAKAVQS